MARSEIIDVIQSLSYCQDRPAIIGILKQAARDLTGADGIAVVLREGGEAHYTEENAMGPSWKGARYLATVPIGTDDPMGALSAYWAAEHKASAAELAVLQALAEAASIALRNTQ